MLKYYYLISFKFDQNFYVLIFFFFQFMGIIYLLQFFWIFVLGFLVIATFIMTVFWKMCSSTQVQDYHQCIDLTQFRMYRFYIFLYLF